MTRSTTPWRPRPLPTRVSSSAWRARHRRIVERDAYVCAHCGHVTYGEETYVDLRVPVCEGAIETSNDWYAVFCRPCYVEKKHRERERWSGSDKP